MNTPKFSNGTEIMGTWRFSKTRNSEFSEIGMTLHQSTCTSDTQVTTKGRSVSIHLRRNFSITKIPSFIVSICVLKSSKMQNENICFVLLLNLTLEILLAESLRS